MNQKLSIIIPFCGEYPQVLFTIQSIASTLQGKIDFEIIAVNNDCAELRQQWKHARTKISNQFNEAKGISPDMIDKIVHPLSIMAGRNPNDLEALERSGEAIRASCQEQGGNQWLKYMRFSDRLSHWECKRLACQEATGDVFLFVDSHCIASNGIDEMFEKYLPYKDTAVFHMPLTYKILEWRRMAYKMVIEKGFYHYSLTGWPGQNEPQEYLITEVPVMSSCGLMISRKIYEKVGGWPMGFGAYGGGENFMNYALTVIGIKKYIYNPITLHHHGEKRDYHSDYTSTLWNRLVAHYLFGGSQIAQTLADNSKGRPEVIKGLIHDILNSDKYKDHRAIIKKNTKVDLQKWVKGWEA